MRAASWGSSRALRVEDAGAGEEGADDLERWVLGGGADEGDGAVFDVGEDGVLLGLVEAVDLVDKENRFLPRIILSALRMLRFAPHKRLRAGGLKGSGLGDDVAEISDAGGDGGEADEVGLR